MMGFSRALPSSLDLPNFEVRDFRRETVQNAHRPVWNSGNLEIQESVNLESTKRKPIRMNICSAQNVGRVLICKTASLSHLGILVLIWKRERLYFLDCSFDTLIGCHFCGLGFPLVSYVPCWCQHWHRHVFRLVNEFRMQAKFRMHILVPRRNILRTRMQH